MNPTSTSAQDPTVALTADVSQFMQSLDKALNAYKTFAQRTEEAAAKAAQKQKGSLRKALDGMKGELDKTQGKLNGITQAALGFTVAGKVAELAEQAATSIRDWATGAKEFNKALEKSLELNQKLLAAQGARIASAKELTDATGAGSPTARAGALQAELESINKNTAGGLLDTLNAAKAATKEIDSKWNKPSNFARWLGGNLEGAQKDLKAEQDRAQAAYDAAKARAAEIEKELARIKNPLEDPEKIANVSRMVAEFDRARLTLGLSEEHAKRLSLELDGFAPEQIERVMASFKYLNEVKTEQKIRDITKELKKQADTFGMSANEVKLYDLAQEGFTEAQLERIRQEMQASEALIAQKEREAEFAKQVDEYMKEQLKIGETGLVGAQAGGTSGAVNAIAAARADTARFANATPEQKAEMTRQQQLRAQLEAAAELRKVHAGIASMVGLLEGLRAV